MNTDPEYAPDYYEQLRWDLWELEDAIALLLNIDPKKLNSLFLSSSQLCGQYADLTEMAVKSKNRTLALATEIMPTKKNRGHFQVTPKAFINWAHSKSIDIPEPLMQLISNENQKAPLQTNADKSQVDKRVSAIVEAARNHFPDPLNIPSGGKSDLRKSLCESDSALFTISTFDKAWIKAKQENLIQVANVDQYKTAK